ncbi:hypothetical protein EA758_14875 [Acinetobacter pittii]|uniref:Uncharacterized protein n=1 Tax=Acinetobacter pittii TaxID=48296 RepID=A0AB37TE03_ACIPI|nr:hypothetical protein [Acinetobacter pittii]RSO51583.1 hypothetical protein EA758_14875 [Acinetobacter pittii]RSO57852.1 hypothetical protein EA752_14630 [Acinetobacter pittii]
MKQKFIQSQTTPILHRPPTAEEQKVPWTARFKANAIATVKMLGFLSAGLAVWGICGVFAAKWAAGV